MAVFTKIALAVAAVSNNPACKRVGDVIIIASNCNPSLSVVYFPLAFAVYRPALPSPPSVFSVQTLAMSVIPDYGYYHSYSFTV